MLHRELVVLLFLLSFGISYAQVENISKDELLNIGLPVLEITSVDEELPTCDIVYGKPYGVDAYSITNASKVPGRLTISTKDNVLYDSGEYIEGKNGMTFKIRGNTSGLSNKKPYKIKLQKKADLLCRNDKKYENKNWVLIYDKNYLGKIGLKVNELMGLQWTPAFEYVNVMINGKYQGLYMLLESVERDKDSRINVSKSGYLFEYDMYWWKEDLYVQIDTYLPWKMYYTFKYPESEDMTEAQLAYFKEMITAVEASINDGTYPNYIDLKSFASWILAHDILGTADGSGSNIYLTKYDDKESSKVMMANMWDFDSIIQKTSDWSSVHSMFYFKYLFNNKQNNSFKRAYRKRWDEVSQTIFNELNSFLDEFVQSEEAPALDTSADLDDQLWKWNIRNCSVQTIVNIFRQYLENKQAWLTWAINNQFPSSITGDVNLDDVVNDKDLTALVAFVMTGVPEDLYEFMADVNSDGVVNVADIVDLISIIKTTNEITKDV